MSMLARIPMDVIHMPGIVVSVPDQVFPIAPLPDTAFPFARAARIDPLARWCPARKPRLDQGPPDCEIRIAFRQGPQGMKMIGQDHDGIDAKRVALPNPRITSRKASTCSTSRRRFRSARLTVKK